MFACVLPVCGRRDRIAVTRNADLIEKRYTVKKEISPPAAIGIVALVVLIAAGCWYYLLSPPNITQNRFTGRTLGAPGRMAANARKTPNLASDASKDAGQGDSQ
jgi:hypothetical protein